MTCQHGMIIKVINRNLNNVKVKHRFRRRRSVDEFDTRKIEQRKEPSHIAYDNMLGVFSRMQWIQDDMEGSFKEQMNRTNMH